MAGSNTPIPKICAFCKRPFNARKITAQTCSNACAKSLHKRKQREAQIAAAQEPAQAQTDLKELERIKQLDFLNVQQVRQLLGCSKQTIYRLIGSGRLKAVNLASKKTIIKRSELDQLFA